MDQVEGIDALVAAVRAGEPGAQHRQRRDEHRH